jgi:hypothetical protein
VFDSTRKLIDIFCFVDQLRVCPEQVDDIALVCEISGVHVDDDILACDGLGCLVDGEGNSLAQNLSIAGPLFLQITGITVAGSTDQPPDQCLLVEPVEWVAIPAEAKLGICLVASEILYAGFEWQLANALFSFSKLFDKVLVLDAETPPMDLARAFDDIWVKAHPAHDWKFSESAAPAAAAPLYRRDGATGSNVYINAAWDPRWDEEYIAPRVTFEATYPEEIREAVRADWTDLGFDHGPEYDPTHDGDGEA